jgi:hypothetical protein
VKKIVVTGDPKDIALLRACYSMLYPDVQIETAEEEQNEHAGSSSPYETAEMPKMAQKR